MLRHRPGHVSLQFAALVIVASTAAAQSAVHIQGAQQAFADLERRYAVAAPTAAAAQPYPVQQTAFVGTTVAQVPTTAAPPSAAYPPTIIPPSNGPPLYPIPSAPGTADVILEAPPSDAWCLPPTDSVRTSSWTAAFEVIPSETFLTDGQFGRWDDNNAVPIRIVLGYEDANGVGIRGRFWGLSQDVSPPADDITLNMSTGSLDLYKRIYFEATDVAFGGGPAGGGVEFVLSDDTHSRFEGGGITMFVDGYYTLSEFTKSEIGAIARARYTMLIGDWRDTTGIVVPRTDGDTMSVVELAWGLEYRRRFGPCEDHHWFVGWLIEYQRWQSDWMSNLAGTQIGVAGCNIYTGIAW